MYKICEIEENTPYKCNCVKYARSKVPNLPFGLWTIWNKKAIINSQKSKEGNIAIMDIGKPWGHVGIVVKRIKKGKYKTIREANFRRCKITERTGTTKKLKILGYFNPRKE